MDKNIKLNSLIKLFFLPISGLMLVGLIVSRTHMFEGDSHIFHGAIEIIGGIIAYLVVTIIHLSRNLLPLKPKETNLLCAGLLAMGTLDILHAFQLVGNNFVWLHSLATFVGGLLFALNWCAGIMPEKVTRILFRGSLFASFAFGMATIIYPAWAPAMLLENGQFSFIAVFLNIGGGIGFLLAFGYFFKRFMADGKKDNAIIALHCFVFGLGGVLFMFSQLWDSVWWWWHILRLIAYLFLINFIINAFVRKAEKAVNSIIFLSALTGLALLLLSVGVISGWYDQNIKLVQIYHSFAPMQYNTALGFFLFGLGIYATIFKYNKCLKIFSGGLIFLSGATLIQYIFSINFGIDEFFVEAFTTTKTSHPGRMAPNTALCFMLSGLGMFFVKNKKAPVFCSAAVFVFSLLAFVGYATYNEGIYGWGSFTKMAIHTACGFIVGSLSLFLVSAAYHEKRREIDIWQLAPPVIFMLMMIITLLTWQGVRNAAEDRSREDFIGLIRDTQTYLENRMDRYESALWGGVGLYNASNYVDRKEWTAYVNSLNIEESLPGINGIGFIEYVEKKDLQDMVKNEREKSNLPDFINHPETDFDDKFIIKYIIPYLRNKEALGLDIGFEANRREAAEFARDTGKPALTKKIILVQDQKKGPGFLLLIPVYKQQIEMKTIQQRRDNFVGWVYAPFMGEKFLSDINDVNKHQLRFEVYDGDEADKESIIYASDEKFIEDKELGLIHITGANFVGRNWTIKWHPTMEFEARSSEVIEKLVIILGVLMSVALAGVFMLLSKLYGSAAKELMESQMKFRLAVANAPIGMALVSTNGRWLEVNKALCKILGYSEAELLGMDFQEITHPDDLEKDSGYVDLMLDKESDYYDMEKRYIHKDGSVIWALLTVSLVFDENEVPKYLIAQIQDISAKKNDERIQNELMERLVSSNEELERFAYICSHDLQEPLRMIRGFTSMLQKHFEEHIEKDEKAQDYIGFITDGAIRAQDLINDLLEYARLENDAKELEEVDLDDLLHKIKENLNMQIKEKKATITIDALPIVRANKTQMVQLFQNLITNGIKFCEKKPKIHVGVEEEEDFWHFWIKDNGIGIKKEYQEKIFAIFQRLHKKTDYSGTGIGLAVCKKIVEKMGGKIWVESKSGRGAIFHFTFAK